MPSVMSVPLTERNIFGPNQIGRRNIWNFSLQYSSILYDIDCLVKYLDEENKQKNKIYENQEKIGKDLLKILGNKKLLS